MKRCLSLALVAFGCSNDTGLGYRSLDVEATHVDGSAVGGFPEQSCTTLPILLGSRASAHYRLSEGVSVDVDASRDAARVRLSAAGYDEMISVEQLESGFSRHIDVSSAGGEDFSVSLTSGCPAVQKP